MKTKILLGFFVLGALFFDAGICGEPAIGDTILVVPEIMPSFPGGQQAMIKFIRESMQFPEKELAQGIQGRVILQFVVERDGSIADIVVVRGVNPALDREAIRIVESMPKWIPGKQSGRVVRTRFTLPINFRIDDWLER